jgi:hypothetical protein
MCEAVNFKMSAPGAGRTGQHAGQIEDADARQGPIATGNLRPVLQDREQARTSAEYLVER